MIVRRFVDGIFQEIQRKQCQQWLESNGWSWENITSFGGLCSQIVKPAETGAPIEAARSSAYRSRIGEFLEARGERRHPARRGKADTATSSSGPRPKTTVARLRRSQRLVEKLDHDNEELTKDQPVLSPSGSRDTRTIDAKGSQSPRYIDSVAQEPSEQSPLSNRALHDDDESHVEASRAKDPDAQITRPLNTAQMNEYIFSAGRANRDKPADAEISESCPQPSSRENTKKPPEYRNLRWRDHGSGGARNPAPQLVPHKRGLREVVEDSSDDSGVLYRQRPRKHSGPQLNEFGEKCYRQQRLPLPPPPEIPILSSSSEE